MKQDLPEVVARFSALGQTAVIAPTVLFTPLADGQFRVSLYAETPSTNPSTGVRTSISWTDDFSTQSPGANFDLQGGVIGSWGAARGVISFFAKAGTAILLSTDLVPGLTLASPYSVMAVVEAL